MCLKILLKALSSGQTILARPTKVIYYHFNSIDLLNSTWRSHPVVHDGGVSSYSKLWPGYISNDHEMDLYLY